MVEPKHQGLIIPKSFSFNFRPERIVTKAHYTSGSTSTEQQLVNKESNNQSSKPNNISEVVVFLVVACYTTLHIYKFVSNLVLCTLVFFIDDVTTLAASRKHGSTHSPPPIKGAKAAPDSAGESGSSTRKRPRPHMSLSQRRERHNNKERERR